MPEHLPEKGCERRADPAGEGALGEGGGSDPAGTHISSPCPRCRRASWPRSSPAPRAPHPAPDRARRCHHAPYGDLGQPRCLSLPVPLPAPRGPGSPSPGKRQPHLHLPCASSSSILPPLPTCRTLPSGSPSSPSPSPFQLHSPAPRDGPCPRDLHLQPHSLGSSQLHPPASLAGFCPREFQPHLILPGLLSTSILPPPLTCWTLPSWPPAHFTLSLPSLPGAPSPAQQWGQCIPSAETVHNQQVGWKCPSWTF